jgi:hypothetical protein
LLFGSYALTSCPAWVNLLHLASDKHRLCPSDGQAGSYGAN